MESNFEKLIKFATFKSNEYQAKGFNIANIKIVINDKLTHLALEKHTNSNYIKPEYNDLYAPYIIGTLAGLPLYIDPTLNNEKCIARVEIFEELIFE